MQERFRNLMDRALAAAVGKNITSIELFELGDGSHRWAAFVNHMDGEDERCLRIAEPAPETAAPWAKKAYPGPDYVEEEVVPV